MPRQCFEDWFECLKVRRCLKSGRFDSDKGRETGTITFTSNFPIHSTQSSSINRFFSKLKYFKDFEDLRILKIQQLASTVEESRARWRKKKKWTRGGERDSSRRFAGARASREKSVFTFRSESQCRLLEKRTNKTFEPPVATAPQSAYDSGMQMRPSTLFLPLRAHLSYPSLSLSLSLFGTKRISA